MFVASEVKERITMPQKTVNEDLSHPPMRRGKLASALSLLGVVAISVCVLIWALSTAYPPLHVTKTVTVRVASGDTVSGIVRRYDSQGRVQELVAWVDAHNHIKDGEIVPNQLLVVPEG